MLIYFFDKKYIIIFTNWLKTLIKNIHYWCKVDPENKIYLEGIVIILIGVNALLFQSLIFPSTGLKIFENGNATTILLIIISVIWWAVKGLTEIFYKKIELPLKYSIILQFLFIPITIILYKIINYFKINVYERKN